MGSWVGETNFARDARGKATSEERERRKTDDNQQRKYRTEEEPRILEPLSVFVL